MMRAVSLLITSAGSLEVTTVGVLGEIVFNITKIKERE